MFIDWNAHLTPQTQSKKCVIHEHSSSVIPSAVAVAALRAGIMDVSTAGDESSQASQDNETGTGRSLTIWATLLALVMPTRKPLRREELEHDPDGPDGWRTRLAEINHELDERRRKRELELDSDSDDNHDTGGVSSQESAETGVGCSTWP
eukprot:scaffold328736_cov52-Tisochrysis_lutea.AAC.1